MPTPTQKTIARTGSRLLYEFLEKLFLRIEEIENQIAELESLANTNENRICELDGLEESVEEIVSRLEELAEEAENNAEK